MAATLKFVLSRSQVHIIKSTVQISAPKQEHMSTLDCSFPFFPGFQVTTLTGFLFLMDAPSHDYLPIPTLFLNNRVPEVYFTGLVFIDIRFLGIHLISFIYVLSIYYNSKITILAQTFYSDLLPTIRLYFSPEI